MATPTININMDKRCTRCGDAGATEGGLCLRCAAARLRERRIMEKVKLNGFLKKQTSTVAEIGVVCEVVISFTAKDNPGVIEAMPTLQAGGPVQVRIENLQGDLFPKE